ncbi:hypothetical protein JNK13_10370 [bacterium]|nr:hypothetical protein [bacterium]
MKKYLTILAALLFIAASTGCSSKKFEVLNPYNDSSSSEYGERSTKALIEETGGGGGADNARHALNVMGQYRSAQAPEPYYPVVQPAEVRLMWVPDHLTKSGDLVPAHYYYLRVLNDRWAVQDAYDLEQQLNQGSSASGATPWIYKDGKGGKR